MKITKVLVISSILSLAVAGSAFATDHLFTDTGTVTIGAPSVGLKPSKNVRIVYRSSTTQSGNGSVAYLVAASHSSGSKTFCSSSGDTKMFMQDGTSGGDVPAPPEASGASADFTGWTPL